MTTDGATLFVIGTFTAAGGATRGQIAGIDLATGLATSFDPQATYLGGQFSGNLLYGNSKVYLAAGGPGGGVKIGGTTHQVAELDPSSGSPSSFNPPVGGIFSFTQTPLLMDGTTLYLGGFRTAIRTPLGPIRTNLVAWDFTPVSVAPTVASSATLGLSITPNPVTSSARIHLTVAGDSRVRVAVFDLQGRLVARLADGWMTAGSREFLWDGSAPSRRRESGVYFVKANTAGDGVTKRLLVLR